MKKFKSLLSILLSIMMIAAMIPFDGIVAFAAEDENKPIELKWKYIGEENPIQYYVDGERIGRFNISDAIIEIKVEVEDPVTHEKEMVEKLGLYKIWDCGLYKYEWKLNS